MLRIISKNLNIDTTIDEHNTSTTVETAEEISVRQEAFKKEQERLALLKIERENREKKDKEKAIVRNTQDAKILSKELQDNFKKMESQMWLKR